MKVRLIITGEYDITDDPAQRQQIYGATDPFECAKVDAENSAEDLLSLADRVLRCEVHPALSAEDGESDPAKLNDAALTFAMGIHDDDCPCAYCAEWQKRRAIRDDERRQVAEEMIAEIKRVIGGYPENAAVRPKSERGRFLNDVDWAIDIVRRIGHVAP
ncbi:hypothetical protein [Streptosporangium vulgare]|uniref:Uncharacterized protein n=1 Tax=Streptosporangium vulgare TaxID=46190 RepID=A0ABV5TSN7_9ACTN